MSQQRISPNVFRAALQPRQHTCFCLRSRCVFASVSQPQWYILFQYLNSRHCMFLVHNFQLCITTIPGCMFCFWFPLYHITIYIGFTGPHQWSGAARNVPFSTMAIHAGSILFHTYPHMGSLTSAEWHTLRPVSTGPCFIKCWPPIFNCMLLKQINFVDLRFKLRVSTKGSAIHPEWVWLNSSTSLGL